MSIKAVEFTPPARVLISGLGSIGRRHLRLLRQQWPALEIGVLRSGHGPDCSELQLADRLFTDMDTALDWQPSGAVIASPAPFHLEQALPLARNSVPLLIEKPIGTGDELPQGWQELLTLSRGLPVLVAYVLRHDPCASFVKHQLEIQCLGKLVEADFHCGSWLPGWRPGLDYRQCVSARRELGGGVLLELSHELDIAQYLLGQIKLDSAIIQNSGLLELDVEDQAILLCRDSAGLGVTIRLNFCTQPTRRAVILRGSQGELQWNIVDSSVQLSLVEREIDEFKSGITSDERYLLQLEHFFACISGLALPLCSVEEALKVLDLVGQARFCSAELLEGNQ